MVFEAKPSQGRCPNTALMDGTGTLAPASLATALSNRAGGVHGTTTFPGRARAAALSQTRQEAIVAPSLFGEDHLGREVQDESVHVHAMHQSGPPRDPYMTAVAGMANTRFEY